MFPPDLFCVDHQPHHTQGLFLSSQQGTISLDGHDIRQLNPVWLRSKIGTVSQEPI